MRRLISNVAISGLGISLLYWAFSANHQWFDRHFLPDFRISASVLRGGVSVARAIAAAAALGLLIFVRPWMAQLVERRSLRRLTVEIAPSLLAVALALGAAELVLRHLANQTQVKSAALSEPQRLADPEIGWTVRPSHAGHDLLGGRQVDYAFDAHGLRVAKAGAQVDLDRPAIVFTGESIMMGYGLQWPETVPAQVEAMTGIQGADLAVEGYSLDQAYMRLRRQWPRFKQPVAVVSLFLPQAFYRETERDRPHLSAALQWRPAADDWRLVRILRQGAPYHAAGEIEAGVLTARQVLRATADMAHRRGAAALVVAPVLEPETAAEQALRHEVLDEAGIDYVLVPIDPRWRIPGDRHPDARGAEAMARAIVERLRMTRPAAPAG